MVPTLLTEQGHHLCSLWSRDRKGHAHRACAAPLAVGMVQVGCVLLNPHMHPKNILMNVAHSSQGFLTLKGQTLLGPFPEVWEQQRGREAFGAGREREPRSPAPGASQLKTLRGGMKFSPGTSLLHTATFQKFNVNMQ